MNFEVKDAQDRVVIKIDDAGNLGVARFPDLPEEFKTYVIEIYKELTDEDPEALRRFLDYEEEEDEFCV